MTIRTRLAAAGLTALALLAPGAASAQSAYCLDSIAAVCGDLPVNQCMVPEDIPYVVPAECVGDAQMLFEMAAEADAQEDNPAYENCDPSYGAECDPPDAGSGAEAAAGGADSGFSFGGNLRDGPGDDYAVVGSLPEGSWVSLTASGTWSGGYQWFWVESDYGAAYHWGGLVCSMDYYVEGVLQIC